jgi:mRNA-degrading endonuclease toxin of MazEF toxin-antitoxin module
MNLQRGDVLKARFPHASGGRGKKRPDCLICCTLLSLMTEFWLKERVGNLSADMLSELDERLKAALGIG